LRLARADLSPLTRRFVSTPLSAGVPTASPADTDAPLPTARSPLWDRTLLDRLQQPLTRYRD
jgi:hypothetical protein